MIATFQKKKKQRARKCGYRVRARKSPDILKRRRAKGRWRLSVIGVKYD